MPADFLACCKRGGKVFTLDGDKGHPNVPKGHIRKMCEDKDGTMHAGHLEKKKGTK